MLFDEPATSLRLLFISVIVFGIVGLHFVSGGHQRQPDTPRLRALPVIISVDVTVFFVQHGLDNITDTIESFCGTACWLVSGERHDLIAADTVDDTTEPQCGNFEHSSGGYFYDALNEEVAELLDTAAERAEVNDRKTVHPRDL